MYDLLLGPFELGFMRRALAGCLALAVAGPPVGVFLVLRRMSLMSDVLQHGVLPGIALGAAVAGLSVWAMGLGGILAGLAVALFTSPKWGPPAGGAIVGAGVACMHYLGMWAVEVPGRVTWHLDLVVGSIVLGMGLVSAVAPLAAQLVAHRQTNGPGNRID